MLLNIDRYKTYFYNNNYDISMIILYDSLIRTKENYSKIEGVGAIYQRILSVLALSKKMEIPFVHKKVNIGHNYDKIDDSVYDEKWNSFFNLKKYEMPQEELNKNNIINPIYIDVLNYPILLQLIQNKNLDVLVYIKNPYLITYNNPNEYYSIIQNEIIELYDEVNNDRPLIYNKTKKNIAIHIRVYNDYDDACENDNYHKALPTSIRHYLTSDFYIKLIEKLNDKYDNAEFYIFSQEKYFDFRYKDLRNIPYLNFHLTMDNFSTFHHLCKADVLVLGTSSFSHLAGFYNKNDVYYTYYEYHSKALDKWIDVNEFMDIKN